MERVTRFFNTLFVVGPPVIKGAYRNQGFSRATELFSEVRAEHPPGLVTKGIRLLILCSNYVRPQCWADTGFDWFWYALRKGRRESEVATWREIYSLGRLLFFGLTLFLWHDRKLVWIVAVLLADMILQVAGDVLVWGKYAISIQRTLMLSLLNYAEMTLGFAVFYSRCNCLDKPASGVQALYLSTVTSTTLGYLPKGVPEPSTSSGLLLIMIQLAVFFIFVLLFINSFLSRFESRDKSSRKSVKCRSQLRDSK